MTSSSMTNKPITIVIHAERSQLCQELDDAFRIKDLKKFSEILKAASNPSTMQKLKNKINNSVALPNLIDIEKDGCLFEDIVKSDRVDGFAYFSAVIKYSKLWDVEEFWNKFGTNFMQILVSPAEKTDENQSLIPKTGLEMFFSVLMHDWFVPNLDRKRNYSLNLKMGQFNSAMRELKNENESNENYFIEKLYAIINDKSNSKYQNVSLRILRQFMHEDKLQDSLVFDMIDKQHFTVENQEVRDNILQALLLNWINLDPGSTLNLEQKNYKVTKIKFLDAAKDSSSVEFVKMAFQLKENLIIEFQETFMEFLQEAKANFGDYWSIAISHQVRLLSLIAGKLDLNMTVEFVIENFPYIGINSTSLTSLNQLQTFKNFKIIEFGNVKLENLFSNIHNNVNGNQKAFDELHEYLKTVDGDFCEEDQEWNLLMFGRSINQDAYDGTVYEKILSTPNNAELIRLIWEKFHLESRAEMLTMRNSSEKLLLDYVIASEDDSNLLAFLMHGTDKRIKKRKLFIRLMAEQFQIITGKTLIERYLGTSSDQKSELFPVIFSLLEEFGTIRDITTQLPMEYLLTEFEKIDHPKIEVIDDLLSAIIAYCTTETKGYKTFREKLMVLKQIEEDSFEIVEDRQDAEQKHVHPLFKILFSIVEVTTGDSFKKNYLHDMKNLQKYFGDRYSKENTEGYISNSVFHFLIAAINSNRTDIIDHILLHSSFNTLDVHFPANMKTSQATEHFVSKLLERGYEIGRRIIPSHWITPEIYRNFLDSRIKHEPSENFIELDCDFLLHFHTKKLLVTDVHDIDDKTIFWEDTAAIEYIVNDVTLKNFITHPAISTYIDLKMKKFQSIQWFEFISLLLIVICLYAGLISKFFIFALIAFVLLVLRKLFKKFLLGKNLGIRKICFTIFVDPFFDKQKITFSHCKNLLETLLISVVLVTILVHLFFPDHSQILFLTSFVVSTVYLIVTMRTTLAPFYFIMFAKVGRTFLKAFCAFLIILLSFTILFHVILKNEPTKTLEEKVNAYINGSLVENHLDLAANSSFGKDSDDDHKITLTNFNDLSDAFVKTLQMMTGEYSIEAFTLRGDQLCIFFVYVMIALVIFNLIMGLAFDDVQTLRQNARQLNLIENVNFIIDVSKYYLEFYEKLEKDRQDKNELSYLADVRQKIIKYQITGYPYLHIIGHIYFDIDSKVITFKTNGRHRKASSTTSCLKSKLPDFKINKDVFNICMEKKKLMEAAK